MKQTNTEADEAVAYIRQNTAAPIQRYLDSVVAARLEEDPSRLGPKSADPLKLNRLAFVARVWTKGRRDLSRLLKSPLSIRPLIQVVRLIRRGQ
jgi:hypothetical protein